MGAIEGDHEDDETTTNKTTKCCGGKRFEKGVLEPFVFKGEEDRHG
jgi:hypothetical protein